MAYVDPTLHWKEQNEVIAAGAERFKNSVGLLWKNLCQGGFMAGQMPVPNLTQRYLLLAIEHDRNEEVAANPDVYAGDRKRAQDALFQEEDLAKQLLEGLVDEPQQDS